jgi:calcineurin-like phosphoesterase family protein
MPVTKSQEGRKLNKVFVIADPHHSHKGMCEFLRDDGTKLRPWETYEEMDEAMITYWNETVRPCDKVYVLGDVTMHRKALPIVSRFNGTKVLIKGNHDIFPMKDYAKYFKDIRAYHYLQGYMMSHIPFHPESLGRYRCNIHGHIHHREVMRTVDGQSQPDPRYICVSAEHTDYRPIEWEALIEKIERRKELYPVEQPQKQHDTR